MSQPIELSEQLVLDARLTGEVTERSVAGQIEFWARTGRATEPLVQGLQAMALSRAGAAQPLSACLEMVGSDEGRLRLTENLRSLPYPHYEAAERSGLLVRTTANGERTVGRFINRQFHAVRGRQTSK